MDIDELFEQMESSRLQLLELLELLPDDAYTMPGAMGDWTVADVLAHLVVWESELITCLMKLDEGKKPKRMLAAIADVDGYNESRYRENKDRDIARIFDDLQSVRVQLEEWLPRFSTKDLTDENRYEWSEGIALWQIVEANTFGHEAEHLPELETFVQRWQAGS
ncbi:MAG: DinB family protein [Candidatus Promineifilaceae bacterium]|jgi:hypothetical protein